MAHFQKPTAATVPGNKNLKEDLQLIGYLRYSNREEPKRSETKATFCYLQVANISFYFIPFHCDSFFSGIFFNTCLNDSRTINAAPKLSYFYIILTSTNDSNISKFHFLESLKIHNLNELNSKFLANEYDIKQNKRKKN